MTVALGVAAGGATETVGALFLVLRRLAAFFAGVAFAADFLPDFLVDFLALTFLVDLAAFFVDFLDDFFALEADFATVFFLADFLALPAFADFFLPAFRAAMFTSS